MSLLNALNHEDKGIQGEEDRLGGGRVWDSGIYPVKVSLAYLQKSAGGALGLFLVFKNAENKELKATLWMTSGNEKGCKPYFEKDGEKKYLPGFIQAKALALLTCGREIAQLGTEMKMVKIYNYDAKTEVPTQVEVVTELLDKEILAGVVKQVVDKNVKNGNGQYVASGETREENEIDKFFRARDRMTVTEIMGKAETAAFADTWEKRWKGEVNNRARGASGTAGAPGAKTAASPAVASGLFA